MRGVPSFACPVFPPRTPADTLEEVGLIERLESVVSARWTARASVLFMVGPDHGPKGGP